MFAKLRLFLLGALAVTLSSCVESEQPLSDLSTAEQDARLYGLWSRSEDNEREFLLIGAEDSEPLNPDGGEVEPGLMRYWSLTEAGATHKVRKPEGTRFFCSKIGGESYANWIYVAKDSQPSPRYFFLKYTVTDNQLNIWLQDPQATARAIELGELGGFVKRKAKKNETDPGEIDELRITDTSEHIAAFLTSGGSAKVFPDKNRVTYTRVK